ncbi:hypothetical protein [Brevundimonas sp.]|uniref:hypothetical protein n=1 Tax=Brevundimonas sp. TaxID=1871086 RepID=UPI002FDAF941
MLIPALIPLLIVGPALMDLPWAELAADSGPSDSAAFNDYIVRSNVASLLSNALQLLVGGMLGAAVYRLVLDPARGRGRPFGLGLGMDELRVVVGYIALFVGVMVVMAALILIAVGVGLAFWPMLSEAGRVWAVFALIFVSLIALLVVYARVCLIPPAFVAMGDFEFGAGWRLGAGQTGRLILMTLVIWLLSIVIALMAYAVLAAVGFGLWTALGLGAALPQSPAEMIDFVSSNPRLAWLGVLILPLSWVYGLLGVVSMAPYASAVRQLTPSAEIPEPAASATNEL